MTPTPVTINPDIVASQEDIDYGIELQKWKSDTTKYVDENALNFGSFNPDKPEETRQTALASSYLDVNIDDKPDLSVYSNFTATRDAYAKEVFDGVGVGDTGAFFKKIQEEAQGRKDHLDLQKDTALTAARAHLTKAIDTTPPEPGKVDPNSFEGWVMANEGKLTREQIEEFRGVWAHQKRQVDKMVTPFKEELAILFGGDRYDEERTQMVYDSLPEEERSDFIDAMSLAVQAMPKEQQATFKKNFAETTRRFNEQMASSIRDGMQASMEGQQGGAMLAPGAGSFSPAATDQAARNKAERIKNRNFRADIQQIVNEEYNPIENVYGKDQWFKRTMENVAYGVPQLTTYMGTAMVPIVGQAAIFSSMRDDAYVNQRRDLMENGYSSEQASEIADGIAPIIALPQTAIEQVQAFLPVGKIPIFNRAMVKLTDKVKNKALSWALASGGISAIEVAEEHMQDAVPYVTREIMSQFSDIPGMDSADYFEGFGQRSLELFILMAPISMVGGTTGLRRRHGLERLAGTPDLELRAAGWAQSDINEFKEAAKQGPASADAAFQALQPHIDMGEESAKVAQAEVLKRRDAEMKAMAAFQNDGTAPAVRVSNFGKTLELYDKKTGEVTGTAVDAADAAEQIVEAMDLQGERAQNTIDYISSTLEYTTQEQSQSKKKTTTEVDLARTTTTDEIAQRSRADAKRIRAQMLRMERLGGGDGKITRAVLGENQETFDAAERGLLTRIHGGGTVLTAVHERAHDSLRTALRTGAITEAEVEDFFVNLDKLMPNRKANGKVVRFLPEGRKATLEDLDEAFSEFMEINLLRSGDRKLAAKSMASMAKARVPGATKMETFLRVMRQAFEVTLGRLAALKKALRDGEITEEQIDSFVYRIQNAQEQQQFDEESAAEAATFSIGEETQTGASFSIAGAKTNAILYSDRVIEAEDGGRIEMFTPENMTPKRSKTWKDYQTLGDVMKGRPASARYGDMPLWRGEVSLNDPLVAIIPGYSLDMSDVQGYYDGTMIGRSGDGVVSVEDDAAIEGWSYDEGVGGLVAHDVGSKRYEDMTDADWLKVIDLSHPSVRVAKFIRPGASFSISPAQDAEYMQAVEDGDTAKQQEMVDAAAKKAGYDPTKFYHGTPKGGFDKFDRDRIGSTAGRGRGGFSFTTEKSMADAYARGFSSEQVETDERLGRLNALIRSFPDSVELWDTPVNLSDYGSEHLEEGEGADVVFDSLISELKAEGHSREADLVAELQTSLDKPLGLQPQTYQVFLDLRGAEEIDTDREGFADSLWGKNAKDRPVRVFLEEGGEVAIVGSPSQIKSADPITRDADGNVVPLSERFNPKDERISFSLSNADLLDSLLQSPALAVTDPEAKVVFAAKIKRMLNELKAAALSPTGKAVANDKRQMRVAAIEEEVVELKEELKAMEEYAVNAAEMRAAEYEAAGVDKPKNSASYKKDIAALKADAKLAAERMKLTIAKREAQAAAISERIRRTSTREALVTLNAILMALPAELRGKVGGFVGIVDLDTNAKREAYLQKRLIKLDEVVERYTRDTIRKQIKKVLDSVKPKRNKQGIPQSKLEADAADRVVEIIKLSKLSSEEVTAQIEEQGVLLAAQADPVEQAKIESKMTDLIVFGDIDGMDAAALEQFYINLRTTVKDGKMVKDLSDEQFAARMAELKQVVLADITGGKGTRTSSDGKRRKPGGKIAGEHYKNLGLEWLFNALARENKQVGTLQSETHARLASMVHIATQQEKRMQRAGLKEYNKTMAAIFGVRGLKLTRKIFDQGIQVETDVEKVIYDNGKAYTENKVNVQQWPVAGLSPEELASGQEYYDAKLAERRKTYPNATDLPKNWNVYYKTPHGFTTEKMMLSQGETINLTMLYRQEGLKESMEMEGFTPETMEQMENFLTPESKKVRAWLADRYQENYDAVNNVFREMNGVSLPQIENYSPATRKPQGTAKDMQVDSTGTQAMSSNPGFTISRTTNFANVDQEADAYVIYARHRAQSDHYVAWAQSMRVLRNLFGDNEIKDAIENYRGTELLSTINERLAWISDNGNAKGEHIRWVDTVRRSFTYASLAYNWAVGLKQLLSLPAYAFDMSAKDFAKYSTLFWKNPVANFKEMIEMEYVKERFKAGADRDVMAALGDTSKMTRSEKIIQGGMVFGRLGDIAPVIVGGWARKHQSYDQAREAGLSPEDALQKATLDMEMSTDRAQQAGDLKDLSSYQGGNSIYKLFTMFKTSPRQYYANVYEAAIDAAAGKRGAKMDLTKRLVLGHIILPAMFQMASEFLRRPFDDEEEEYFDMDLVKVMLLGPLSGLFIVGDAADTLASAVTGSRRWWRSNAIFTAIDDVAKAVDELMHGDDDLEEAALELGESMGRLHPSMSIIPAATREVKRLDGLLPEEVIELAE